MSQPEAANRELTGNVVIVDIDGDEGTEYVMYDKDEATDDDGGRKRCLISSVGYDIEENI